MKQIEVVISQDSAHAVSDWCANEWYKEILKTGETAFVATIVMFNELRVGVRLGEIAPFSFSYEGKQISVNSDAKVSDSFMEHMAEQMFVIMTGRTMSGNGPISTYHNR